MSASAIEGVGLNSWARRPLWSVAPRSKEAGNPSGRPLSVFLGAGVVPRDSRDDNYNQLSDDLSNYQIVRPGDIVFNKLRSWQGGFGESSIEGIVSPAYYVCRPKAFACSRFLHFLFRSKPYLTEISRISKWMPPSQFDTPWDVLRTLPVLLPSLDEQHSIARFLDAETARIDELIRCKARQAELIRDRSNAIINCWVSELENEYGLIKLRRLIASIEQGWSPVAEDQEASEGEWGVLKTASVTSGSFLAREHKRLADETRPDTRYQVKDGDLLVTRGSGSARNVGTGAVAQVGSQKMMISDLIYRVALPNSHLPSYVSMCLNSDPVRARVALLLRGQSGQTIKLRATDIGEIEVPAIPREEQENIVRRAEQTKTQHGRLSDVIEASVSRLAERRQAIITATVTGQVDIATAGSGCPSTRI